MATDWDTSRMRGRGYRSAKVPPTGPMTMAGMNWANPARPTQVAEPVASLRT